MLQLREKLVTGLIGVAFLISAAIRRPLMYELARAGMARNGSTAEAERMHRLKNDPRLLRALTVMTVVWGVALILDVAIACVLVFTLTIKSYLIVNSIEGYIVLGATAAWTFWYARRSRAKGEAARAAAARSGRR
jgi:hypothetical protein